LTPDEIAEESKVGNFGFQIFNVSRWVRDEVKSSEKEVVLSTLDNLIKELLKDFPDYYLD